MVLLVIANQGASSLVVTQQPGNVATHVVQQPKGVDTMVNNADITLHAAPGATDMYRS